MNYFDAVQAGRARVVKAMDALREVTGACSPVLFLRMGGGDWEPVGEACLYSLVPGKNERRAVVICDEEGNAKAISAWVTLPEAEEFGRALAKKGLERFAGELKLPV